MIERTDNPDYLNAFLDYSATILNKSPNSIKEYNYDISNFLKFIKISLLKKNPISLLMKKNLNKI